MMGIITPSKLTLTKIHWLTKIHNYLCMQESSPIWAEWLVAYINTFPDWYKEEMYFSSNFDFPGYWLLNIYEA